MSGATGSQHPPRDRIVGAEMESVVAGLAHHGSEATKEKDMTITEITETTAANGKTMYQRPRQESAASVPSASVWP